MGAQKAGATWLHRNLQAHPGIWMPRGKELYYFDEMVRKPVSLRQPIKRRRPIDARRRRQIRPPLKRYRKDSRESLVWNLRCFLGGYGDRWYGLRFEQGRVYRARGRYEFTSDGKLVGFDCAARNGTSSSSG